MKICSVMLLPALKPVCSSGIIFSACGFNLFSMVFSMTLIALVADEADRSVVLALLQVVFLGKITEDWVHGFCHSPVRQICCRLSTLSTCFDQCYLDIVDSSMIVLQSQLLCEGWGGYPLCLSGDSSVLMDLHWPVVVQLRSVFCPSVQYIMSLFCEAFS